MVVSTVQLDCCAITFVVSVYNSNISPCVSPTCCGGCSLGPKFLLKISLQNASSQPILQVY